MTPRQGRVAVLLLLPAGVLIGHALGPVPAKDTQAPEAPMSTVL